MKFRKNAILYYALEFFCIVMAAACFGMISLLGLGLSLISAFPFVILMLASPRLYDEFITINQAGIQCEKAEVLLWQYAWDSIAKLEKSSRFRMPSIEVIPYGKSGAPEPFRLPGHYFQLGRAARKAIKQYYTFDPKPY